MGPTIDLKSQAEAQPYELRRERRRIPLVPCTEERGKDVYSLEEEAA